MDTKEQVRPVNPPTDSGKHSTSNNNKIAGAFDVYMMSKFFIRVFFQVAQYLQTLDLGIILAGVLVGWNGGKQLSHLRVFFH